MPSDLGIPDSTEEKDRRRKACLECAHDSAMEVYPGDCAIRKAQGLTFELREIEATFAAEIEANTLSYIAEYKARFGTTLNTDDARELSQDYANSIESRALLARAVHEPASALVKRI